MPVKYQVTMYKCKYRCGKHSRNQAFIEGHERHCWKNPERKTCKTCPHEEYFSDSAGDVFGDGRYVEPAWYVRGCLHPDADEIEHLIGAIYRELEEKNPGNGPLYGIQVPPLIECPLWMEREK